MNKGKKTFLRTVILSLTFTLFYGCSNFNDVIRVHEDGSEGTTEVYSVSADTAWTIARTVFRWEGADAIEEHKDEGYMLTSSGVNLITWGTVMGAWVSPITEERTQVTVVTKRRVSTNIATTLTEGTFHKRFAEAVEMVKKGDSLPLIAP